MKLIIKIILLCFAVGVNGQVPDALSAFIKVTEPDNFRYFYKQTTECPFTEQEAVNVVEGVVKRSRIRPYKMILPTSLHLNLSTVCIWNLVGDRVAGYSVMFNIRYGDYPMLIEPDYGGLRIGSRDDKEFFLNSFTRYVENAITDFVEVNFLSDSN